MLLIPECIERADGSKFWFLNGLYHRTDGPALEYADGSKAWYLNGLRHRTDGPALEQVNGTKYWFLNGLCHRTDGPAIEWPDGSKFWYLKGKQLTAKEVEIFKHLQVCPKKELLEWVGTIFTPIIERKMKEKSL